MVSNWPPGCDLRPWLRKFWDLGKIRIDRKYHRMNLSRFMSNQWKMAQDWFFMSNLKNVILWQKFRINYIPYVQTKSKEDQKFFILQTFSGIFQFSKLLNIVCDAVYNRYELLLRKLFLFIISVLKAQLITCSNWDLWTNKKSNKSKIISSIDYLLADYWIRLS